MQIQKEHTREQILQAAEQAFHQQGFAKTSMRDIARLSGVGVGNLYNYFPKGKDEIFRLIVSPLIQDMERMVYEHHDERHAERYLDYLSNGNPELLEYQMREYLSLMHWAIWNDLAMLWGCIIAVSQVITALKPVFHFGKHVHTLNTRCYKQEALFLDLDNLWYELKDGSIEKDAAKIRLNHLKQRISENEFFDDEDGFEFSKELQEEAAKMTSDTLQTKYNITD